MHKIIQGMLDELPKALLGALVPLAQYLWRVWSARSAAVQLSALHRDLGNLRELQEAADRLDDSVKAAQFRQYVQEQREQIVSKLLAGSAQRRAAGALASPAARVNWQRWFLLYAPTGLWAWTLHVLFFISASFVAIGVVVMMGSLKDPELGSMALGFGVFALLALLFRTWAVVVDQQRPAPDSGATFHPRSRAQRAFLLYKPSSAFAGVIHALYYVCVLTLLLGVIGVAAEWDEDSGYALLGFAICSLLPIGLAAIANRLDARRAAAAGSLSASAS